MALLFLQEYGATRLDRYTPQPFAEETDDEPHKDADLDYDPAYDRDDWHPHSPCPPANWDPASWPLRPIRFIDGKDVGETVAWLRAPGGYPVPVRLGQIGSVVMALQGQELRRDYYHADKVVALVTDPFPWDRVEAFAQDLQRLGFRLLSARPPDGACTFDFERMRKAAQSRSNTEMESLEEAALAQPSNVPTVVDGRLAPRSGGIPDPENAPVYGVIKTHRRRYLHDEGMRTLYRLEQGQRTPLFAIAQRNLDVVSWYLRLSGGSGPTPNYGIVRVEVSQKWFERHKDRVAFADCLSMVLCHARCRQESYGRAAISLHPIVRAESSLGACFHDHGRLTSQFCRLAGL
ncbi:MAG: hypothetical protein ACE5G0_01085 [Rhodothermales bacterium]